MHNTKEHAALASVFNQDEPRVNWHDETLWFVRHKRDKAANGIPEWEQLRELASQIKRNALSDLDRYLTEFEKHAVANGLQVHWASDAQEHNEIIAGIIRANDVQRIVKSKSMLTEECGLKNNWQKGGGRVPVLILG